VTEREEDGQVGEALLERPHHLAAPPTGLGCILVPGLRLRVPLLRVGEEPALVFLHVEEDARAVTLAGEPGGEAGVAQGGGMVVEPVEVAGRGVEPEEVVREPADRRRLQVVQGGLQFRLVEGTPPPAEPGEVLGPALRVGGRDVEDAAIEGRLLHLGDLPPQERRVGLIPAELDQPLDRAVRRCLRPGMAGVAQQEHDEGAGEDLRDPPSPGSPGFGSIAHRIRLPGSRRRVQLPRGAIVTARRRFRRPRRAGSKSSGCPHLGC